MLVESLGWLRQFSIIILSIKQQYNTNNIVIKTILSEVWFQYVYKPINHNQYQYHFVVETKQTNILL